jgi:hypothetical protein
MRVIINLDFRYNRQVELEAIGEDFLKIAAGWNWDGGRLLFRAFCKDFSLRTLPSLRT